MRSRQSAIALALIVAFYLALVGPRASVLIQAETGISRLIGIAILMLPIPFVWFVWRETRFGRATQRLADELDAAGRLPQTPRHHIDPDRSQLVFAARRLEVQAAPDDWAAWYRLGLAYDAVGDRGNGRAAMRHAVALHARRR